LLTEAELRERLQEQFGLISKGSVFDEPITADTDIFDPGPEPTNSPTTFRIYACFDAGGVLSVTRTANGGTVTEQLNGGAKLNADAAYIFDIIVESGESVNLQYSVSTTALTLKVLEVPGVIS